MFDYIKRILNAMRFRRLNCDNFNTERLVENDENNQIEALLLNRSFDYAASILQASRMSKTKFERVDE